MGSFEEDFLTKLSFGVRLRNVAVIHQVVSVHSVYLHVYNQAYSINQQ